MKQYTILGMMAISLYACTNDVPDISELKPSENVPVTEPESGSTEATELSAITVTVEDYQFDDAQTRTNIDPTNLSFTWAETDEIGIYPNEGDQVRFPMTKGANTKTAAFDGGGWALKADYAYSAYYPFRYANYAKEYIELPHSYLGQSQVANNSTTHLGKFDFMAATAITPESGSVTFNFQHVNSLIYLQISCPFNDTFTQLDLNAEEAIFVEEATVDISKAEMTPVKLSKSMSIALEDIPVSANGQLDLWLAVAPYAMSSHTITAVLTNSDASTYSFALPGIDLEAGKAYRWQKNANPQLVEQINLKSSSIVLWMGKKEYVIASPSPVTAVDKEIIWSSSDKSVATVDQNGQITPVSIGTAVITALAHDGSGISATCDVEITDDPHEMVDLGTVVNGKTIYWSKINLGATNETDLGKYYFCTETSALGEAPSPYPADFTGPQNDKYITDNPRSTSGLSYSKYYDPTTNKYTKYLKNAKYGEADGKTELDQEDDAASANWGERWRIPSAAEIQSLFDNCNWTRLCPLSGYTFKVSNKSDETKYIFIQCNQSSPYDLELWTRTVYDGKYADGDQFRSMHVFDNGGTYAKQFNIKSRYKYLPIRPVYSYSE